MHIIEPCCAKRHLMMLRDAIGKTGTKQFEGYGDLSLTELLPALLTRYSETEMLIAAPSLPDQAAEIIGMWMKRQWARMDGKGKLDVIRHLTVIADLSDDKSPTAAAWLKDNPFGGRLTLCDHKQPDTAILLPDFAITGPVNMRYCSHFTATATADPARVSDLWEHFKSLTKPEKPEEPATLEEPVEPEKAGEAKKPAAAKRSFEAGRKRRTSFRR